MGFKRILIYNIIEFALKSNEKFCNEVAIHIHYETNKQKKNKKRKKIKSGGGGIQQRNESEFRYLVGLE